MNIEWGNAAEWVGSVGTVLTLALGLVLLRREIRDNRKRHASRVIAWIDTSAGAVHVKNGGEEPITNVMLALFTAGHYADPMSGQGDTPFVESWEWLGPSESRSLSPKDADWHADLYPPQARLEFTDMTGQRWLRNERGVLSEKRVRPFPQDRKQVRTWKRNERETTKARQIYTRWRWPNV
ncbi:hypothetical protein L615_004400000110 [Nocardioides sp. J9]|uniref:hypothetical protein n=1 Tax=Nocardioides sp. J9 TaxID=935844 RepID=UPI00119CCDDB|nr:hypothetical protein [Nocardioides sp. J9]TWG96247.1 hypothetical protein L615_004400000110 [Nocardioides sp. J9]